MDWTAGYASDIEYTAGFYKEQGPAYLNFVCILNGIEPVPLDKPFTYFELGFGRGLTVSLLAAANPHGQFYAADFNPGQVAGARDLAARAELHNLTLYEASFEELAAGKEALPQFDFITLHGIYTWVTGENQQHIVDFIARYLKPGGIVYLSYNAMPGWAAALPLQRLLVEFGEAFPNRSDIELKGAANLVERMQAAGASYLAAHPGLKQRLDMLKTSNPNYLVHEYMHKHWEPLYHADVARALEPAKLEYAGSAELPLNYPTLYLNDEKRDIIATMSSSAMRETMKDYFANTSFRKDVFVRGARKIGPLRQAELLRNTGVALNARRAECKLEMSLAIGLVNGKPAIYEPLLDALAEQSLTLGELQQLPALNSIALHDLAQAVVMLVASGQAQIYVDTGVDAGRSAGKLNRCIASLASYSDELQALCSPLLGSGMHTGFVERLVFQNLPPDLAQIDQALLVRQVWSALKAQGRKLIKEGETLQTDEANMAELTGQVDLTLKVFLPMWRMLKII